jgi:hypothetical protein
MVVTNAAIDARRVGVILLSRAIAETARTTPGSPRMSSPHESIIGSTGTLTVATRGASGPGEVVIRFRGGTEAYIAWSEHPIELGTTVVVFNERGGRQVDVEKLSASPAVPDSQP